MSRSGRTARRAGSVHAVGVHLGLDLGGTNAKCAVLDASLRVLATDSRPNGAADGPDAVLDDTWKILRDYRRKNPRAKL